MEKKIIICHIPFKKILEKFFKYKIPFKYVIEKDFIKLLVNHKILLFQKY